MRKSYIHSISKRKRNALLVVDDIVGPAVIFSKADCDMIHEAYIKFFDKRGIDKRYTNLWQNWSISEPYNNVKSNIQKSN